MVTGLSLVLGLLVLCAQSSTIMPVKRLAGPPSEFSLHRTPSPDTVVTTEKSTAQYIWFQPTENSDAVYTLTFPVETDEFAFSFASPHASDLTIHLVDPNGKPVDLTPIKDNMPIGDYVKIPTDVYIVKNSVVGAYVITITSTLSFDRLKELSGSDVANGVLIIVNIDNLNIESHYSSFLIKQGQEIGIISKIVDANTGLTQENVVISKALMEVVTPQGQDVEVVMKDDDESLKKFNYTPNSGVYGATLLASTPGKYLIQAKLEGEVDTSSSALKFFRSTQHVVYVSSATLELTGFAHVKPKTANTLSILLGVQGDASDIRAYTEVWGKDSTGAEVPVCWLGGVVFIENGMFELELNIQWLQLAGVTGALTLKNSYVSDLDTTFPISFRIENIVVENSQDLSVPKADSEIEITLEMRQGVNPLPRRSMDNATASGILVALPGYCSPENPWAQSKKFTNAKMYLTGGNNNWSNNKFADNVLAFVKGIPSFSLVGHSQGGMISAHMHNFYFTGLESAANGRKIQSVGTPWLGCTAAGSLAGLGDIFGVGCGSNNDLSVEGAAVWISGITSLTRGSVHYYTTTYQQGNMFGDSCSLPMNMVLGWPNDGCTEVKHASLQGGKNEGNTQKQCHTTAMSYSPQYYDENRNAIINANAAR